MVNLTLQSTNQDNVISSMNPLKWKYRIDFFLQRLQRLNYTYYTDTIFAKDKFIFWNTCARMFKDGEFAQIISIR